MDFFIKHVPRFGFPAATLILIAVGGVAIYSLSAFMASGQSVTQTLEVINELETAQALLTDAETGQRGYVITGEAAFLEPHNAAVAPDGIALHLQRLRQLTADDPNQQERLDTLEPLILQRLALVEQIIALRRDQGFDAARQLVATGSGKKTMDEIRRVVGEMKAEETRLLESRAAAQDTNARYAIGTLIAGAVLVAAILTGSIVLRRREEIGRRLAGQAVRQLNAELEARVGRRTAELTESNQALQADIEERRRAEAALRASEDRLQTTMDSMLEGGQIIGFDWRYLYVNAAAAAQGQQPREQLLNRTMQQMYPGIEQTEMFATLRRSMEERVPLRTENEFAFPDGSKGWFDLNVQPVPEGIFILSHDITQRKRAEQEIRRQLERLAALRAIDMAITSSLDLRLTMTVLLEQVTTQLGVHAADVLLLDPHTLILEYAAGRGFRTGRFQKAHLHVSEGRAGQAALERRIIHAADLRQAQHKSTRRPLPPEEEFVSHYAAPLVAKGQVKGVLEIFHRAPLAPDPEWLSFLEALAGQAAIAIDNASLFDDLQRKNVELSLAYDDTIEGWSAALDLRDKETEGHSQRVTDLTLRLAQALGLPESEHRHIRHGALLHDIGKMGIPDAILLKPGKLTDDEWAIMRRHPQFAYDLLHPIAHLRPALDIPYCHHEKWDGTGYPRGLKGEKIPLAARLFAVVDVWDALRSDRPYRAGWPEDKVIAHIQSLSGTHFDPPAVDVFLRVIGGQ